MTNESLNGYEFIATYRPEAEEGILPGRIIMGMSESKSGRGAEYVTAYLPDGHDEWCHGHYLNNRLDASKDYAMRTARGL